MLRKKGCHRGLQNTEQCKPPGQRSTSEHSRQRLHILECKPWYRAMVCNGKGAKYCGYVNSLKLIMLSTAVYLHILLLAAEADPRHPPVSPQQCTDSCQLALLQMSFLHGLALHIYTQQRELSWKTVHLMELQG